MVPLHASPGFLAPLAPLNPLAPLAPLAFLAPLALHSNMVRGDGRGSLFKTQKRLANSSSINLKHSKIYILPKKIVFLEKLFHQNILI